MLGDVKGCLEMDSAKPMKILLIEDDISACREFVDCVNNRTDIVIAGMTESSDKGIEYVKSKLPEAIVLDLELNWGQGSGFEFLDKFQKLNLDIHPIIVITTQNRSVDIQSQIHAEYGIDFFFSKFQKDYSAEMVIRHLLRFRSFLSKRRGMSNPALQTLETPEELEIRLKQRIKAEMDGFGISVRYTVREIAAEAIYAILYKGKNDTETVFQDLARKRGTHYNNIVRPLQTAINDAWQNHDDIEALLKLYTAPVRKDTGGPSPTEFSHFYAVKIRRDLS
jgi:DNA-binding NarL/FixJ family response regulator